jgi:hypothetical protein
MGGQTGVWIEGNWGNKAEEIQPGYMGCFGDRDSWKKGKGLYTMKRCMKGVK